MHVIYFACPGRPAAQYVQAFEHALAPLGDFALIWITPAGFSSVFHNAAHALKRQGRILPELLRHHPPPNGARPSSVSLIAFSAGYGFAYELLAIEEDRAALDGLVLLDGLHTGYDGDGTAKDTGIAPFAAFAREALHGKCCFAFGHTDVSTYRQYASTTESANELIRHLGAADEKAKDVDGRFATRVQSGGLTIRAYDWYREIDAKKEHGAALVGWGPGFVGETLVPFLLGQAPPSTRREPSSPPTPTPTPTTATPTLRRGDREPATFTDGPIHRLQHALIAAGESLAPYGADGGFGAITDMAVRSFQRRYGLTVDGICGPLTWAALLFPELRGPKVAAPPAGDKRPAGLVPVSGNVERAAAWGSFSYRSAPTAGNPEGITITDGWASNLVSVEIPELAKIPGVATSSGIQARGPSDGRVLVHRKVAEPLKALWRAWADAGLLDRVLTWHGLWAPRYIRGSRTTLSNHAWATAFDVNAPWNGLGATPAAVGQRGSVRELVALAAQHGFYWGGWFGSRPDGMHFEASAALV